MNAVPAVSLGRKKEILSVPWRVMLAEGCSPDMITQTLAFFSSTVPSSKVRMVVHVCTAFRNAKVKNGDRYSCKAVRARQ